MRVLIFLVAIVLILALIGWISFSSSPGRSSINIETQQIEEDTDRALESGADLLKKAGDSVDSTIEMEPETSEASRSAQGIPTQEAPPASPAGSAE